MANLPQPGSQFSMTPEELAAYNRACPPTGNYYARAFKFVHFGTREELNFNKVMAKIDKFRMYVEILSHPPFIFDKEKGLQPWTANVESTYSTGERSNLFKYIKNIYKSDPKIIRAINDGLFPISSLMNQLVMIETVQTINKTSGKANIKITNITSPMEIPNYDLGPMRHQKLYNEIVMFDIIDFVRKNPLDIEAFKKLYKFEREIIAKTDEFLHANLRLEDFALTPAAPAQYGYVAQPGTGFAPVAQQGITYPEDINDPDELDF
jgi:hypothetical protein